MHSHLDEHVDHAIADGLRQRGIDVTTTTDAGLIGASDEHQLEFSRQQGRIVFTQDADFLRLHQSGVQHAGIVYSAPGQHEIGEIVRFLCLLHDCVEPVEMETAVEFV